RFWGDDKSTDAVDVCRCFAGFNCPAVDASRCDSHLCERLYQAPLELSRQRPEWDNKRCHITGPCAEMCKHQGFAQSGLSRTSRHLKCIRAVACQHSVLDCLNL